VAGYQSEVRMNAAEIFDRYQSVLDKYLCLLKRAIIDWLTSSYFGDISPDGTTFAVVRGSKIVFTFGVVQPTQGGYNAEILMAITEDQVEFGVEIDRDTILVPAEQIEVDEELE
jgi:hypothetical protein